MPDGLGGRSGFTVWQRGTSCQMAGGGEAADASGFVDAPSVHNIHNELLIVDLCWSGDDIGGVGACHRRLHVSIISFCIIFFMNVACPGPI